MFFDISHMTDKKRNS